MEPMAFKVSSKTKVNKTDFDRKLTIENILSLFRHQTYMESPNDEVDANIDTIMDCFDEIKTTFRDNDGFSKDDILQAHCKVYLNVASDDISLDNIKNAILNSSDAIKYMKDFSSDLKRTFDIQKKIQKKWVDIVLSATVIIAYL